jgi:glycosyltransferase involved in cell wall biosynthesis
MLTDAEVRPSRLQDGRAKPAGLQRKDPIHVLSLGINWFNSDSGGLDRVFSELIRALPDAGIKATGLVLEPPDFAAQTAGSVISFGRPGATTPELLWRARLRAGALIDSGQIDLVAGHFAMFAFPVLGRLRNVPFVAHFHGPWGDEAKEEGAGHVASAIKRTVERTVYRQAQRVIVLSQAFGLIARDRLGVPEERLRIVPGIVDLERFNIQTSRAEAREKLGWPPDRRIVVCVRRLVRRMGLDRLIAAVDQVARTEPDLLLMIAGRGHMAASLKAQVETLGLARHVCFLGFVPDADLPLIFRAAEINLIPTLALEGFGLTAVEALACGTPSVVSPVGGLPEVVEDLSANLIFPSCSADDMAEHLTRALNGELPLPDEQSCREYVQARYSAGNAASAVAAVYREVV